MREYGNKKEHSAAEDEAVTANQTDVPSDKAKEEEGQAFNLEEEREEGAIALSTHAFWLRSMGSPVVVAAIFAGYVLSQGSLIVHTLWLGLWQSDAFPWLPQSAYQCIYAAIGAGSAIILLVSTTAFVYTSIRGSVWMCNTATAKVMSSAMSWLDRTPTGRLISRLTSGECHRARIWLPELTRRR